MADYYEEVQNSAEAKAEDEAYENDFFDDADNEQQGSGTRQDSGLYRGHFANIDDNYFKK